MTEDIQKLKSEIVQIENAMLLPINSTPIRQRALRSFIKEKKNKIKELKNQP